MPERLRDRAKDRWVDILPQLGIPGCFLNGRHQPCPMCGGKDRARFTNHNGDGCFICTHCGAGDGVSLVMRLNKWTFKEAAERIEALIGRARRIQRPAGRTAESRRRAMQALWQSSIPIRPDHPVGRYLTARTGLTEFPPCLRALDRLRYWGRDQCWFPAMIAMVSDPAGKPAILHRTFLTHDGRKAPVEAPRMMMPGSVPKGSAVRLAAATHALGIAEGIETALSAAILHRMPVWAALSTSLMIGWEPPAGVEFVVVFGDHDTGFAGQAAAYALAHRLATKWRVGIRIPERPGDDWNDVLRRQLGIHGAPHAPLCSPSAGNAWG